MIRLAFRPGFQNPPEASALEPAEVSLKEAATALRRQIARIHRGERMTQEAAVEGPYSPEQWLYIHLRHAELHLSFLAIEEKVLAEESAAAYRLRRDDPARQGRQ
jgi:hypothetical protein